jgi:hypothetical protein
MMKPTSAPALPAIPPLPLPLPPMPSWVTAPDLRIRTDHVIVYHPKSIRYTDGI